MKVITRSRDEVFDLWLNALRSGQYQQGFGRLKEGNNFCCLGVVCDLAAKDGGKHWRYIDLNEIHGVHGIDPFEAFPPDNISEFLFGKEWRDICEFIATKNDSTRYNFNKMADLIEKIKSKLDAGLKYYI